MSVIGALEEGWHVQSPKKLYTAFFAPMSVGAFLTLGLLALIEACGVNPLIDQYFRITAGSRTYREIQAERNREEHSSLPPSQTRTP